jgi:hypothetical protein
VSLRELLTGNSGRAIVGRLVLFTLIWLTALAVFASLAGCSPGPCTRAAVELLAGDELELELAVGCVVTGRP